MFGQKFYHGSIRQMIVLFGKIFNNISIDRVDRNGSPVGSPIKIPIVYGPKQKWYTRLIEDPNAGDTATQKHTQVTLPMMAYEMKGLSYDPNRKLQTANRNVKIKAGDHSKYLFQYNPVPWNIKFSLYIYVKSHVDGLRIVEQICPYFTPDFTVTNKDIPELSMEKDIPIILQAVTKDDALNSDPTVQDMIIWTLDFELKGYLYPRTEEGALILEADTSVIGLDDALNLQNNSSKITLATTPNPPTAYATDDFTITDTEVDTD